MIKLLSVLVVFLLAIIIKLTILWVCASAILSGFKTATDNCDKVWPIDKYVSTDWFCENQ